MPLEVKVISYKGHPPVEPFEASFGQDGGTLGRSPDKRKNHLTLPDPEQFISRRHASITFANGLYYLTDTSVDGTYIQNKNIRVYRDTVALADGDRLRLGDYELVVRIPSNGTPESDPFAFDYSIERNVSDSRLYRDADALKLSSGEQPRMEKDSEWWPDKGVFGENAKHGQPAEQTEASPLHDSFTPPVIAGDSAQPPEIPKNFNFEELISSLDDADAPIPAEDSIGMPTQERAIDHDILRKPPDADLFDEQDEWSRAARKARPNPMPPSGKLTAADSATIEQIREEVQLELFQAFLGAAGVKDTRFLQNEDIPALMQTVGAVFKEMINGLTAILRGRSELKLQLRVAATTLKPTDNNPLKFSPSVDDTLRQLLTKDQTGFVDAIDAVREGYADIMNHQLAMTAGIQAAVIKLLERFDPDNLAKQHEEGVVFQRKAKSWDAYRQAYAEIANDALEDFFGEPFARAYEAQIRKLKPKTDEI